MKNEFNLDDIAKLIPPRPSAIVKLPSLGLFYDQNVVKDGMVEIMPLSAREEKLVAGIRGNNVEYIIDVMLKRCLVTPIDPDDLLVTDRFFLLLTLRANSYGEEYNFEMNCPYIGCEAKGKYTIKVPSDFKTKFSDPKSMEPFSVKLPDSGREIGFRLLRGKDQKAIKLAADKENQGEGDPAFLFNLATPIVTVDGKPPANFLVAMKFVERLSGKDTQILQAAYEENTPGLVTTVTKPCVKCGKEIEQGMPVSAEFFHPKFG